MTTAEIWRESRRSAFTLRLCDTPFHLRQMELQKLIFCINPKTVTGKLYFWTPLGRYLVCRAFPILVDPFPTNVDWRAYAQIISARIRKVTLLQLAVPSHKKVPGRTATMTKYELRDKFPVGLNSVIRTFKELLIYEIIECVGTTRKRGLRLFQVTEKGWQIIRQLLKEPVGPIALSEFDEDKARVVAGRPNRSLANYFKSILGL